MSGIICHTKIEHNSYSSDVSYSPLKTSTDLASQLLNQKIRNNIDSFYRSFTKQEIEVFMYLAYFFSKWNGNIQIPIKNLMARFGLGRRRILQLLARLKFWGVVEDIKKGHTGSYTKRTLTERGVMLWKAITKGFKVAKQVIPKNSAHSIALSPGGHTNYISTKVKPITKQVVYSQTEEPISTPHKNAKCMKSYFSQLKGVCFGNL